MTHKVTSKGWKIAASAVALALIATACGGDDDDDGVASDDTADATADDTADATADDTAEATADATAEDTADATAEDTADATAEATAESSGDEVDVTQGGGILDAVIANGTLRCGVAGEAVAFSQANAEGRMEGIDAEYCRAVAAAVLGDSEAVEFTALTAAERFTAVQTGAVDVLMRNSTWTQSRDTEVGMDFGPTTYYDGQQLMGRASDGFSAESTVEEVDGAIVCTNAGTTTETNISELAAQLGITITLNTFEDFDQVTDAFVAGTCDVITTDGSGLVGRKAVQQPADDEWVIFPASPISKEPLGPVYAQNDSQWADVINWTVYATFIADELGFGMADADAALAGDFGPEAVRLMGGEGELQTVMGLSPDAFYNVISQVGNYQDIWDRTLTPVGLDREGSFNAQWTDGGLLYAPPAR
jgi:general L-amino acid transport system substrate-binding protein